MKNNNEFLAKRIMSVLNPGEDVDTFMNASIVIESRQVALGVNVEEDEVDSYVRPVSIHVYYNKYDDVDDPRRVYLCNVLGCLFLSGDAFIDENSPDEILDDFNAVVFEAVMTAVKECISPHADLSYCNSVLYIQDIYRMNPSIDNDDIHAFMMENIDDIVYKLYNVRPDIVCMGIDGENENWTKLVDGAKLLSTETKGYSVLSIVN